MDGGESPSVEATGGGSVPTGTFEAVANETRLAILHTLVRAQGESPLDPWLSYSELRDAVGVRDNGNFNYHLDRLDGLVVKGPEGYRISRTGVDLVAAVASGTLDPEWTWGPVDAPGECPFCGDDLRLRYADGELRLECGTDEHTLLLPASPALLESHSEDRVVERVAFAVYRETATLRRGICPDCDGRVAGEVRPGLVEPTEYHFHAECHRCRLHHGYPVGATVLPHPAVIDFFAERGTDVRSTPLWTLDFCIPGHETVLSTDPLRLRVAVVRDGERLSLTLDGEATVTGVERSDES